MAKLYFRYGAMNSGKSTALMQVAYNYEERGMRVLIMKPSIDTKGGEKLMSRLGVERRVDIAVRPDMDPLALVRADIAKNGPLACVLTDESQFFTSWQAEQLFMVTVALNVPVICYGLRADFSLQGFPGSTRLLELAHNIEEMKTICVLGKMNKSDVAEESRFAYKDIDHVMDQQKDLVVPVKKLKTVGVVKG